MTKFLPALLILFYCGSVLPLYGADSDSPSASDRGNSATVQIKDGLIAELGEILRQVAKQMPAYQDKKFLMSRRNAVIRAFVKALGSNLGYSLQKYHQPATNRNFEPLPLLWLQNNRIAYLRLDAFNPAVVDQFRQLHDILLFKRSLVGLIIDLRQCRTFDYKSVQFALKSFMSAYQNSKHPARAGVALLIGPRTLGAVEYFIRQLRNSDYVKSTVIGLPTAGEPFTYHETPLSGGGYLLLPKIPPMIAQPVDFAIQSPTIKIVNNRQGSYGSEQSHPDATVKYSSELLLAINVIGGKNKK